MSKRLFKSGFHDATVRTKLQMIVLATLIAAVIPASIAILSYDWVASREALRSDVGTLAAILGENSKSGLLTVGENLGFAANAGVVNLVLKDGKVRLEINVGAADKEGLRISAKLLKLAEIVK